MKKQRTAAWYGVVLVLITSMALSACGSGSSSTGAGNTAAGQNSVAYAVRNVAPLSDCPNGGISVDAGIDTSANGTLDPAEVTSTQYVCNGADGSNGTSGLTALVSLINEPAGGNCAYGGKNVSVGLDTNGNSILDASEITSSNYVCNGANGGTNGTNGSNGFNSLVSILTETAGAHCAYGGQKINSGLDANNNGALEVSEVTTTNYVCNGAPGSTGATGPAGSGVTWVDATSSMTATANTDYMADNSMSQVVITLPSAPSMGDSFQVTGVGAAGWKIAQNAGQSIITKDLESPIGGVWTARDTTRSWYSVASSADGIKLVAVVNGGQIYTSTNSGVSWVARDFARNWQRVASSADGTRLAAVVYGGQIYTSADSGVTWTARDSSRNWSGVSSTGDGTRLAAVVFGGQIYTSTDSGVTWNVQSNSVVANYNSVAMSADGTKLATTIYGGMVLVSTNSGVNWVGSTPSLNWWSVTISADGTKMLAVNDSFGQASYKSSDSGSTWTALWGIGNAQSVAMSADGSVQVAGAVGGQILTSTDSGATWRGGNAPYTASSVALSADGRKLVAGINSGQIYTSGPTAVQSTTVGTAGSISGWQYDAIELQYIGSNTFTVLSNEGYLTVK